MRYQQLMFSYIAIYSRSVNTLLFTIRYTSKTLTNAALNSAKSLSVVLRIHHHFFGTTNSCGFMFSLQSFAMQPASCRYVCTPSRMRMCVKPISRTNSNLVCSESESMVLVTLNMVEMMSWDE